jgi:hypothetical protein
LWLERHMVEVSLLNYFFIKVSVLNCGHVTILDIAENYSQMQ